MSALSIIIPCFNEEKRLSPERFSSFLNTYYDCRLLFVNDGSTDNTLKVLTQLQVLFPDRVKIISLLKQCGKGEAVRTGLLESIKETTISHHGYIDADLAVSAEEIYRLFEKIKQTSNRFIFGSRIKKIGTKINRNEWRHFYSRVMATIVGWIIKLDVYDTQCSAKVFKTEIVNPVFKNRFHTKWLFDVELICRIHNLYGELNNNGTEEPLLKWEERKGSKLRWFHFFGILKEVFILKKHYRRSK